MIYLEFTRLGKTFVVVFPFDSCRHKCSFCLTSISPSLQILRDYESERMYRGTFYISALVKPFCCVYLCFHMKYSFFFFAEIYDWSLMPINAIEPCPCISKHNDVERKCLSLSQKPFPIFLVPPPREEFFIFFSLSLIFIFSEIIIEKKLFRISV